MAPPKNTLAALLALLASAALLPMASSFSAPQNTPATKLMTRQYSGRSVSLFANDNNIDNNKLRPVASAFATVTLLGSLLLSPMNSNMHPPSAFAYEESDYASETVTAVVQQLKDTAGDEKGTFKTLEEVAAIITEGKGVGGSLSYSGVKLTSGYVADEDTTIYNPGLSLLTGSEKERLVDAIIQSRKTGLSTNHWSEDNQYAFDFLKQKLDPLHMYELGGYLKILPFWGAALYLGALFVQQNSRGIFPLVYGLCALGVFGPVIVLVAFGGP